MRAWDVWLSQAGERVKRKCMVYMVRGEAELYVVLGRGE